MSQSGSSNPVAGSNNSSNAGASSANVLPAKDKSRSDAGDQSKSKTQSQPQPQAAPQSQSPTKMDCGSDSPADACVSSGSSESDRAAGRNASSPPAPGRKVTSEASDLKESLPHSSDLNGAPIVASAASSQIGGPGGYNRNNNWNSGGYNRNRNGMGRNNNWGSAGGRNCGPHSVHNSRPPHMAPRFCRIHRTARTPIRDRAARPLSRVWIPHSVRSFAAGCRCRCRTAAHSGRTARPVFALWHVLLQLVPQPVLLLQRRSRRRTARVCCPSAHSGRFHVPDVPAAGLIRKLPAAAVTARTSSRESGARNESPAERCAGSGCRVPAAAGTTAAEAAEAQ